MSVDPISNRFTAARRTARGYRARVFFAGIVLPAYIAWWSARGSPFGDDGHWSWDAQATIAFSFALAGGFVFLIRNKHRRGRPAASFLAGGVLAIGAFFTGLLVAGFGGYSEGWKYYAFAILPMVCWPLLAALAAYASLRRLTGAGRPLQQNILWLGLLGFLAGGAAVIGPEFGQRRMRMLARDAVAGDQAAFAAFLEPDARRWLVDLRDDDALAHGLWMADAPQSYDYYMLRALDEAVRSGDRLEHAQLSPEVVQAGIRFPSNLPPEFVPFDGRKVSYSLWATGVAAVLAFLGLRRGRKRKTIVRPNP